MPNGFQASLPVTTNLQAVNKDEAIKLAAALQAAASFTPTLQGTLIAWKNAAQDAAYAIGATTTEVANEVAAMDAAAQSYTG